MQSRRHCPTHANMNRALNDDDDDNDRDDDVIAVIIFGSNIFFFYVLAVDVDLLQKLRFLVPVI